MDLYPRNLEAIARRDSALAERLRRAPLGDDLERFRAADGAVTVRIGGRPEASEEAPTREGRELGARFAAQARAAGAKRLVVFGFGVHTLVSLAEFEGDVLVLEPRLDLVRLVLEAVDLTGPLSRVRLAVGETADALAAAPLFAASERGVLVAHPSAKRRAGALFEQLVRRFRPGGERRGLDIAVIPPLYGGSLPVAHASARALAELGHRVRAVDLEPFFPAWRALSARDERLRAALVRLIGESIAAGFEADPPDVVFALAQAPLDVETLERFRRQGIARALWFCEDFRVMTYWPALARAYDVIFHVQPDDFESKLREAGGFGVPLPMAFDPSVHAPRALDPEERARFGCDVSFVGAGYPNRVQFLPGLFDLGLRVYGTDWPGSAHWLAAMPEPNRRQSSEDSNRIWNASKIALNLHSSPWCDGVNPVGDYLNPRVFELAGAGAFQLVDERRDLARSFTAGEELETYRDLDECRRKIAHYRARPDERAAIAERARTRALREHTYRDRMARAVDALESGPVPLARRAAPAGTIGAALDDPATEPELREILGRVARERRLDAESLGIAVARGSGELTRAEKLVLFMREARAEVKVLNAAGDPA